MNQNNIFDFYYHVGIFNEMIIHPQQILTLYPDTIFLQNKNDNKIYVNFKQNIITLSQFIKTHMHNKKFDYFFNIIDIITNNYNQQKIFILLHM